MEHLILTFLDHTQRRSTVGRTPLDEWSARRRDLCLTTHDTHNRQISKPPVGFEPTISTGERPAEIVGSNPTGGMDICLLWVSCVVRQRSLRRADHSSRGVLPTVVRRCVWSRNIKNGCSIYIHDISRLRVKQLFLYQNESYDAPATLLLRRSPETHCLNCTKKSVVFRRQMTKTRIFSLMVATK